jgi:hypothetical protein
MSGIFTLSVPKRYPTRTTEIAQQVLGLLEENGADAQDCAAGALCAACAILAMAEDDTEGLIQSLSEDIRGIIENNRKKTAVYKAAN